MRGKKLFTALALAVLAAAAAALAANAVSVIVKRTTIRKDRQFTAAAVAQAFYKEQLTVLAEEKDWLKVSYKGKEGWIHVTAVSSRTGDQKGLLSFGRDEAAKVSEDEVTLAGKGFSQQVEDQYRKEKPELNFKAVDEMEKASAGFEEILAFAQAGDLEERGDR